MLKKQNVSKFLLHFKWLITYFSQSMGNKMYNYCETAHLTLKKTFMFITTYRLDYFHVKALVLVNLLS